MGTHKDLVIAKSSKKDEFYTEYSTIENEMKYYTDKFNGKVIYCNCDDYRRSNFVKYFSDNFEVLDLKKLIATCYDEEATQTSLWFPATSKAVKFEKTVDGETITQLKGNGSFNSTECLRILDECDIVVTNPPFSLFRSFMQMIYDSGKDFLVIGNMLAITYKQTIPLLKENKVRYGVSIHSGDIEFEVPDDYPLEANTVRTDEEGKKYIRVKGVRWITNLEHGVYDELITKLEKSYNEDDYPKLDFHDAINVNKTSDIPNDYYGMMAVPVSYLDKHNPNEFEVIGITGVMMKPAAINGKEVFKRVLIRRKEKKN